MRGLAGGARDFVQGNPVTSRMDCRSLQLVSRFPTAAAAAACRGRRARHQHTATLFACGLLYLQALSVPQPYSLFIWYGSGSGMGRDLKNLTGSCRYLRCLGSSRGFLDALWQRARCPCVQTRCKYHTCVLIGILHVPSHDCVDQFAMEATCCRLPPALRTGIVRELAQPCHTCNEGRSSRAVGLRGSLCV